MNSTSAADRWLVARIKNAAIHGGRAAAGEDEPRLRSDDPRCSMVGTLCRGFGAVVAEDAWFYGSHTCDDSDSDVWRLGAGYVGNVKGGF